MMGTFNCVYETPCGWCSKWDKKCDRKITESSPPEQPLATAICDHDWERVGWTSVGTMYTCRKCNASRTLDNPQPHKMTVTM